MVRNRIQAFLDVADKAGHRGTSAFFRASVAATKFLLRTNEEIAADDSDQEHIRRMLDKSLQTLGMDHVNLYIYHM